MGNLNFRHLPFCAENTLQEFKSYITLNPKRFLKKDSVLILVCGKKPSDKKKTGRSYLIEYGRKHLKQFKFFEAEKVIGSVSEKKYDLLSIEDKLSTYSDCIIIILESEGAIAEAGAFAIRDEIAKIVLLINDTKFEEEESFINLGPIAKIERVSKFGKAIYTNTESILNAATEITQRLAKIERSRRKGYDLRSLETLDACPPKIKMLFLADLISLFSPIKYGDIIRILKVCYGEQHVEIDVELGMLMALNLIEETDGYYWRSNYEKGLFFDFDDVGLIRLRSGVVNYYSKYFKERLAVLKNRAEKRE